MAVLVVSLALPLVTVAAARADTAYVTGTGSSTVVHLDGDQGNYHGVYVFEPTPGTYGLQDSGRNTVTPGAGCVRPAADTTNYVECTAASVARVEVQLGDIGDDFRAGNISKPVVVHGGGGPDNFYGYDEDDTFYGDDGDDTFYEFWGSKLDSDVFYGGPGHDAVSYWARDTPVQVTIDGVANDGRAGETDNVEPDIEEVDGGQAGDTIVGSSGDDELFGDAGADNINGKGGNDRIIAGNWGCGDADRLYGGAGNDWIESRESVYVDGGSGDDTLEAGLCSWSKDYVGGTGNDTILLPWSGPWVARLDDVANDGAPGWSDNYHADIENVKGGDGPDLIVGSNVSNVIDGGPGDDTLDGAGGADVLRGGDGDDAADYSSRTGDLRVSLDGGANDGEPGEGDNVDTDVEDIWAGSGDDVLTGNDLDNAIDGGPGADKIIGGDGNDSADYSLRTADLTVSLDGKANDGESGEGDLVGSDVENIWAGSGDDKLTGDAADNIIDGGLGADEISGGVGIDGVDYSTRDTAITADLDGASGDDGGPGEHDTLGADLEGIFGGAGSDTLTANAADGWLVGGKGNDRLTGLGGEDFLEGDAGDDSIDARDGFVDEVTCGDGSDTAKADEDDEFGYDCEHIDWTEPVVPPVPALPEKSTPAPPAPTDAQVAPVDRTGPQGTSKLVGDARLSGGLWRGVLVQVSCNEDCSATATIKAIGSTARYFHRQGLRGNLVGGASIAFGHTKPRTVRVRLSSQARTAVGSLRTGRFELDVTLTDARGNSTTLRRTVKLNIR